MARRRRDFHADLNWRGDPIRHGTARHLQQQMSVPKHAFDPLKLKGEFPGLADPRLHGVVTFCIERLSAADICRGVDAHGVALRGGHHCAQPLMRAFGVEGGARASIAPYSIDADIDALLEGLEGVRRHEPRTGSDPDSQP